MLPESSSILIAYLFVRKESYRTVISNEFECDVWERNRSGNSFRDDAYVFELELESSKENICLLLVLEQL